MVDEPLEIQPFTIDAQTQQFLDILAWFDELRVKMLFTPLISAEEMRHLQNRAINRILPPPSIDVLPVTVWENLDAYKGKANDGR